MKFGSIIRGYHLKVSQTSEEVDLREHVRYMHADDPRIFTLDDITIHSVTARFVTTQRTALDGNLISDIHWQYLGTEAQNPEWRTVYPEDRGWFAIHRVGVEDEPVHIFADFQIWLDDEGRVYHQFRDTTAGRPYEFCVPDYRKFIMVELKIRYSLRRNWLRRLKAFFHNLTAPEGVPA